MGMEMPVLCSASLMALALSSNPALAKAPDAPNPDETRTPTATDPAPQAAVGTGQELVVYAQKRAENIQDVPISIAAFGGSQLDDLAVSDITDLSGSVANVQLGNQAVFRSVAQFFIRGIGQQGLESSLDPSVALFVDGVYRGRNAASVAKLLDVEAVEVLRGPQDALYGRNAFAGAISVRNKAPQLNETGGFAEVEYGNYNALTVNGGINVPAGETFAMRLSAQYRRDDGFMFSRTTGDNLGGMRVFVVRPQVLWQPTPDLTVRISGEYLRDRSKPSVTQNLRLANSFFGALGYPGTNPYGDRTSGIPGDGSNKFASDFTPGRPEISQYDNYSVTAHVDYDVGLGTVSLLANYSDEKDHIYTDTDSELPNLYNSERAQHYKSHQAELRFTSDFSDTTRLLVGAFYFHDQFVLDQYIFIGLGNPGNPNAVPPIAPVPAGQFSTDPRTITYGTNGQDRDSFAVYGQVEQAITPRLTATLGLRYSYEKKHAHAYPYQLGTSAAGFVYDPAKFCAEQERSWNALSPRVGLEYRATDDAMVFGFWQRGYKSGGFSTAAASNCFSFSQSYDQERVDNYEIGVKTQFFDRRVTLNVNAFQADYSDLQRNFTVPITGSAGFANITGNAAGARIRGVELETSARLLDQLTLYASVGYLDPNYRSFIADLNGDGLPEDNSALKLIFAPRWDSKFGGSYVIPLAGNGSVTAAASYSHTSYMETTATNAPFTDRAPLSTVDASLTWLSEDRRIRAQVFGRNLFNEVERAQAAVIGRVFAYNTPTAPRTYGVSLSYRFGGEVR